MWPWPWVVIVIVVATRSAEFHIERSIVIAAPPERSFATVNDFHNWSDWSPWEKMDPNLKKTFAGPASGVGSVYAWVGNDKVGEGRMTLEQAEPPSRVEIKLEFFKPWTATNKVTFTIAPAAGGSKVTWAMDGQKPSA
ncbi:MAG TPA: SRPBCC family protein [Polyangiaceae bacterium]